MVKMKNGEELTFSSPSRGSYISTFKSADDAKKFMDSSRPLPGVLISLHGLVISKYDLDG